MKLFTRRYEAELELLCSARGEIFRFFQCLLKYITRLKRKRFPTSGRSGFFQNQRSEYRNGLFSCFVRLSICFYQTLVKQVNKVNK